MPMTAYRRLWAFSLLVLSLALARGLAVPQGVAEARPPLPTPRPYLDCRAVPQNAPSPRWQARVDAVARTYIAPDQPAAEAVARRLGFTRFPSPSNMCGPLSLAILRGAGLVPPQTPLSRFWLLNPRTDRHIIRTVLPPERFCHSRFDQPLNAVDFRAFPLQAGDLLYLYAGPGDTFEHILVVSRVDAAGRVYAVTNLNLAAQGYYVIREVMLYDPQRPGEGQFYRWTDRQYAATIGVTGRGGFELWRPLWAVFPQPSEPFAQASRFGPWWGWRGLAVR